METERLVLRPWQLSDTERLFELAADPHVGPPCGWNPHKDSAESRYILQNILINDYTWALVLKDDDLVIGNISLMPLHVSRLAENDTESEIGYWLGYPYWKHGYMSEACARVIRYGFEEKHLKTMLACHYEYNPASGKVMEKCGMRVIRTEPVLIDPFRKGGMDVVHQITFDEWKTMKNTSCQ